MYGGLDMDGFYIILLQYKNVSSSRYTLYNENLQWVYQYNLMDNKNRRSYAMNDAEETNIFSHL